MAKTNKRKRKNNNRYKSGARSFVISQAITANYINIELSKINRLDQSELDIQESVRKFSTVEQVFILSYYFLATWFTLSLIRFSVFLPKLLRSSSGEIYSQSGIDTNHYIYDPNEKQITLVFSEYGIFSWYLFPSIIFFLLSIGIFASSNKHLQKSWAAVFTTTVFVVLSICTSIFSIWRA